MACSTLADSQTVITKGYRSIIVKVSEIGTSKLKTGSWHHALSPGQTKFGTYACVHAYIAYSMSMKCIR